MAPQLKKGDKVYLLTRNWKTKKPKTKKLDNIKVRLFSVKEKTGPVNIKIRLPRDARVHPNFHILMIEPADQSTPLQETFHYQPEEEQEFEVEQILARKGQQYLVKWKGYPDSENTWKPLKNLVNCELLLRQFQQKQDWTARPAGGMCQWLIKLNLCHLTPSLSPSTEASASHRPQHPPTPFTSETDKSALWQVVWRVYYVLPCQWLHPHRGCPGTCSEIPRTQRHKTFHAECM